MKKILILAGFDQSLVNFRGPLLAALVKAGYQVTGAAPGETPAIPEKLAALGVRFLSVRLARTGLNPLRDFHSIWQLKNLLRRENPEVLLSYTIKPVIYGSLAAGWVNVPRIYALITGLGAAFNTAGRKGRLLRWVAIALYRVALRRCSRVIAQNPDIAELFIREKIVSPDKIIVVPGSGVDTKHFVSSPLPNGPPVFLYLGRLLRDKGIAELVAAARVLKRSHPEARVLLLGDVDPNPASFSAAEVAAWQREGVVEHLGFQADVRPYLRDCTAFVLPSYHEGLPRSVLEAMAVGRPVITTDTIGCRDTIMNAGSADAQHVRTGDNGLMVPVRDSVALAAAMLRLATDRMAAQAMGESGRSVAEQQFDVRRINDLMLSAMDLLPAPGSSLSAPS